MGMASVTLSMDAPFSRQMTQGWTRLDAGTCGRYHKRHENRYHENRYHERHDAWCPVNDTQVSECGCVHQALSPMYQQMYDVGDKVSKHDVRAFLLPASCLLLTSYYSLLTYILRQLRMICEPAWNRDGAAINCIKNQENALVLAVFCLICFSICVQAAYTHSMLGSK